MQSPSNADTPPALEDEWEDIVAKSQAAIGLSQSELAQQMGCESTDVRALRRGQGSPEQVQRFAAALGLDAKKLLQLREAGYPPEPAMPEGWQAIRHPFGEGVVNAYLQFDADRRSAILFDAGTDAKRILQALEASGCQLRAIFLTHTHHDHIGGLSAVLDRFPDVPVYARGAPSIEGVHSIDTPDWQTRVDSLTVRALAISGHSADGAVFFVEEPNGRDPVIISGDALFAGSIGGIRVPDAGMDLPATYSAVLSRIYQHILSASPAGSTILPGHGPITTVAREREQNPFFPD